MVQPLKPLFRAFPLLVAALLATLPAGCGTAPAEAATGDRPLAAFHRALADAEQHGGRVAVLQVGDSHSANDSFSGRMRELLQARFGDGGRGLLPPGIPHDYYRPAQVQVSAEGWRIDRGGAVGFAGLRQHAAGPASMTLQGEGMERATIGVLLQPGGGTLDIAAGGGTATSVATAAPVPALLRVPAPPGGLVSLSARGDGPVDVLSLSAERGRGGASWSNLGTIGATVEQAGRWDPAIVQAEAAALRPALVVLAFGTNEGFKDGTDLAAYPAQFRAALRALRRAAPFASLLVAGPPGGVRRGGAGLACPDGGWVVPANLPRIRAIERRVAAEEGAFFWDWAAAMDGDCGMVAWALTDPPLAARDRVHLLKPGYRQTAEALWAALMQGYERSRR